MWKESGAVLLSFQGFASSLGSCLHGACLCLISAGQLILGQDEKRRNCPICINLNVVSLIHVLIFFAVSSWKHLLRAFCCRWFFKNLLKDENGQKQNSAKCKWIRANGMQAYIVQIQNGNKDVCSSFFFFLIFLEENHKTFCGALDIVFYVLNSQPFKRWLKAVLKCRGAFWQ